MKRATLLTISLCLTVLSALQAAPHATIIPHSRTFTMRDGMPANGISGLAQDSHGLMWIATWNGLCCYDGTRFSTFPGNSWGTDDALSSNRIAMIHIDTRDNLWLRTYDSGLYIYDTHQCRYFNIGQAMARKYGEQMRPRNIYCLPNGYTWVTDETGAMTLRINDEHPTDIDRIEVFGTKGYPYDGNYIRKVQANRQGREWITTDRQMIRYEGGGKFKAVRPEGLDSWERLGGDTALTWRLQACGLTEADIDKHCIDRQGNLWYTSSQGLTLVTFHEQRMQQLPVVEGQQTRTVLYRRDGTVWAGTQDGYIRVVETDLSGQSGKWVAPDGRVTTSRVKFADRIYALFEDSQGRTWIGTKGVGLYVIGKDGGVTHCMPDSTDAWSINHHFVYDFDEDLSGNIWIATYGGGINIVPAKPGGGGVNKQSLRFLHSGNELKHYPIADFARVRRITHTPQGIMLISSTTGLLTCRSLSVTRQPSPFYVTRHHHDDTSSLRTNDVMQVLVTKSGEILVATLAGGIQRLTSTELEHNDLQLEDAKLLNNHVGNVQSMTEDHQGNVWIIREMSIDRYSPQTQRLQQFDPTAHHPSLAAHHTSSITHHPSPLTILTEALPALAPDGRLWLGTMGGLLTYNTNQMRESDYQPNIVFTSVQYQGERETLPLLYRQQLTVTPDRRDLTISFAALDYGGDYLMQYAYRLDGGGWNYISVPHIAFSNLSPGLHTLTVKSTNCDGAWADNETVLTLDVTPTFWERTWVRVLFILLVIGLSAWAVVAWQKRRHLNRQREKRLESILRQYRELQEQMGAQADSALKGEETFPVAKQEYKLSEPVIADPDEEMMNQLMAFIEQRIGDENLKIDEMAEAVNMGRTVFYSKMRELVGMSPSDFLRQVRMQRAEQLVAKSKLSISEVAYAVGFTDPKYFTKCFKKQTGRTPSEYRQGNALP